MADLPHEAKVQLVTLLAQFSGPAEAARIVSAQFGVTLDRRTAWRYDASKKGCVAGPRYRELFHAVRERWLNDLATIPIAHQGHRLRMLDRLAAKLEDRGDYAGALKAIEQAAKEASAIQAAPSAEPQTINTAGYGDRSLSVEQTRGMVAARLAALVNTAATRSAVDVEGAA